MDTVGVLALVAAVAVVILGWFIHTHSDTHKKS